MPTLLVLRNVARDLALLALAASLGACRDTAPPASSFPQARGTEAAPPPRGAPPPEPLGAAPPFGTIYPASPKAPAPVAPPAGSGTSIALERYIVVDQFGYRPDMTKVAILVNPERGWNAADSYTPPPELQVRRWDNGKTVFKGAPVTWNGGAVDGAAGDAGAWFDFSALKESGLFYVFDPKRNERSHPFAIDRDVYRRVLKSATKMYYFNRANFEKKRPYSCLLARCWSLPAAYLGKGQDREARSVRDRNNSATARDLSGGWWDAGDTGKYVTFSMEPVHQLLTAFTEHPSAFGDDFGIPESGNGVPDLLDELLVELEWLKKMQPADLKGGALIKVGNIEYAEPIPDQSTLARYYYPGACSSSTIVVAGQFAHAALVLKGIPALAGLVSDFVRRARDAWAHYQTNPKSDACDDGTIKSGDADAPEKDQEQAAVVAAVYLFAATGDTTFGDYVKKNYRNTKPFEDERWSAYVPSQGDALLFYADLPQADAGVKQAILERKKLLAEKVDIFRFDPNLSLYRAYIRNDSYHWGSNNVRASYGNTNYDVIQHALVPATERTTYLERAAGMLHSFHGVNAMQLVYLTNMYADGGDACVDEMFHAWFRDGDARWDNARTSELGPAPGFVTGGPNPYYCQGQDPKQHACAKSPVREQPPEKAYVDTNAGYQPESQFDKSWELTEPAIYYQASYVRLVSKFVD